MKTLIFQDPAQTLRVEAKVDIMATNAELQTAGFDTRFTNMEIVDNDASKIAGIDLTEVEYSWIAIRQFAEDNGFSLTVIDINENASDDIVTWTAITGTVAGTIGLAAITGTATDFDPELDVDDVVSIDGFVYTIATRAGAADTAATINETFQTTFTGVPLYIKN